MSGGILEGRGSKDVHKMLSTPRESDDFLFPVKALFHRKVWSALQFQADRAPFRNGPPVIVTIVSVVGIIGMIG